MKKKLPYIIGIAFVAISVCVLLLLLNKSTCLINDCDNPPMSGSEYCKHHTCSLDGCNEQKSLEDAYCGNHGCLEDHCTALVIEDERTSYYCEEHRCKIGNCPERIYVGDHCLMHNCSDLYCNEATEEYYSYCPKHQSN